MDLIDSAIYLKEKGLAPKIGILGTNESGSVTALASAFSEPLLFDCAVVHVCYLINDCFLESSFRPNLASLS